MGILQSTALSACLISALGGDLSLLAFPDKPFFQLTDADPYNLNFPVTPVAITYPRNANQVAAVVGCAAQNDRKVQARSGGHSYANYCIGGVDGAVVVDLKNMQQFSYDASTTRATIGAGTLLGDLDPKLLNAGGRAIAHGTCPQVGIGGHATIGGLGPPSRMWGSTLDHVEEVQVVLANSSVVRASPSQNSDVYFALMGAGASFGVVTEFKVRTQPAPGAAVQYSFALTGGDASAQAAAFKRWQTLVSDPNLPRKFASQVTVLPTGLAISGTFFGTKAEFDTYNFTSIFPPPFTSDTIVFQDWLGLLAHWAEDAALELVGGISSPFYSKDVAIPQGTSIPDSSVDDLFKYIASAHKPLLYFIIFDLSGGFISDVPADKTSYGNRKTKYFLQSYAIGSLTLSPETKTFLDGVDEIVRKSLPNLQLGSYAGYVDPYLPNPQQEYWGASLPRLQGIKKAIDPNDVFHNPQSIQRAA